MWPYTMEETAFISRSAPSQTRPAPRSWPGTAGLLAVALPTLRLWLRRRRDRRALLQMSEIELHDIGVGRSEAMWEAGKPFWRE